MSWHRGDFHVHTRRAHGGEPTPAEITAAARACGLAVIAVPEHDRPAEWPPRADELLVIPGQENLTPGSHRLVR
jgi:predicted metal-dependent phosphoesterase TrpH